MNAKLNSVNPSRDLLYQTVSALGKGAFFYLGIWVRTINVKNKPLKTGLFAEELRRLIANFDSKCFLKLFSFLVGEIRIVILSTLIL